VCFVAVYLPNKDMALISTVQNEVDVTRDPRLNVVSHLESLQSPYNDVTADRFTEKMFDVRGSYDSKPVSTTSDHRSSRRSSRANDRSYKNRYSDVIEHRDSNGTFGGTDSQEACHTVSEIKPLQLKNSLTANTQSGPYILSQSPRRRGKRRAKEDLDEILRKRLEKLEAELNVIGSQSSIPYADQESVDHITDEKGIGDGKRTVSVSSHAEKKRKAYNNRNGAGDGRYDKRQKMSDDELERIIAANVNDSMNSSSDVKLDKYFSTILKDEASLGEGLSVMSADFSEEILSLIESQIWERSRNEGGKLFPSSAVDQLVDTETIMLNVLSQNLSDGRSDYLHIDDHDTVVNNAVSVLPQVADTETPSLNGRNVDLKLDKKASVSDLDFPEESKRLGCLSVDTQWDSQFVESSVVKSTHLNSVRDWRSTKLLDLLISGRLKEIPSTTPLEIRHEGTDGLVTGSLQNVLNNLSLLWSDDMLDSMEDVVSNTATNLDSLVVDFVKNSGGMDVAASTSLSSVPADDDITGKDVVGPAAVADKQDDWSHEESDLLDGLAASLDDELQKVLNHTEKNSDVTSVAAASFSSLLESAVNFGETTDSNIPCDMYSPTRPTEMELASSGIAVITDGVGLPNGVSQTNKVQLRQSGDVSSALNDLVENSVTTRRTVRVHKKESVPLTLSTDRVKGATRRIRHGNSNSRTKVLPVSEEDFGNFGFEKSEGAGVERLSDESPVNCSAEISTIAEVEAAMGDLRDIQVQNKRSSDGFVKDVAGEIDSSVDNQTMMDSSFGSHRAKPSSKRSSSPDEVSGKSDICLADVKKRGHSRKHKDRSVDKTGRKNKTKAQDITKLVDQQLKLDVRSGLNHVQKNMESLLCEKYGISVGNSTGMSEDVSLHVDDRHFPDLSGLSFDAKVALIGENKTDDTMNAVCSKPLLNDLLSELNILLSAINLLLPENASAHSSNDKTTVKMGHVKQKQSAAESPSSPPSLRKSAARQTSASRRHKSSEEGGVNIIPHRRQEAPATESEKRLMKADKLMQTFRRSQIARRQSQRSSPQPPVSFIRQVQPITATEGSRTPTDDGRTDVASSELKEPDFSTVITDGSMLASVELPQLPPPKSLPPLGDDATQTPAALLTPEESQACGSIQTPVVLSTPGASQEHVPLQTPVALLGTSEAPGVSHIPVVVSTPGALQAHGVSQIPVLLSTPGASQVRAATRTPVVLSAPGASQEHGPPRTPVLLPMPEGSQAHGAPRTPVVLSTPVASQVPGAPQTPVLLPMPEGSQVPGVPQIPVVLQSPGVSETPVVSQTPLYKLPRVADTVHITSTPAPSSVTRVNNSVDHKTVNAVTCSAKEQRVYVFNSEEPLCQEVKVSSKCV